MAIVKRFIRDIATGVLENYIEIEEASIASFSAQLAITGKELISLSYTSAFGSGYTTPTVIISDPPSGTTAKAVASVTKGSVTSVDVVDGGSGYGSSPTPIVVISDSPSGTKAVATAIVSNGVITGFTITDGGSGYAFPTVSITGGGGTGATVDAVVSDGAVVDYANLVGGAGYTSTPNVEVSGGGGSGATATAVVSGGSVTGISVTLDTPDISDTYRKRPVTALTVTAGGSGYILSNPPKVEISGGGGTGARGAVVLLNGSVSSIDVIAGGSDYTSAPDVKITGDVGSGATATASILDSVEDNLVKTTAPSTHPLDNDNPPKSYDEKLDAVKASIREKLEKGDALDLIHLSEALQVLLELRDDAPSLNS